MANIYEEAQQQVAPHDGVNWAMSPRTLGPSPRMRSAPKNKCRASATAMTSNGVKIGGQTLIIIIKKIGGQTLIIIIKLDNSK